MSTASGASLAERARWIVLVPYLLLVQRFAFLCDDSYITFRYSRNWAMGNGIRYNLGDDVPVEGYSNFLWMAIAALVERLGADVTLWMPLLSILCGILLLDRVYRVAVDALELAPSAALLATLALGTFPPFAMWSTGGLATMPFALLVFVLFERMVLRDGPADGAAIVSAVALTLIRTEGFAWVVVLAVMALVRRGPNARTVRSLGGVLGVSAAVLAAFVAWRWSYYGDWVSNTARVKVGMSRDSLLRGLRHVISWEVALVTPGLILLAGTMPALRRGFTGLILLAMAVAFPAYAVVVGGDYMPMGRLMVPSFAFGAVLLALALQTVMQERTRFLAGVLVVATGLLPGWDLELVPYAARSFVRDAFGRPSTNDEPLEYAAHWAKMVDNARTWAIRGKALSQVLGPDDSFVAAAIGAVGYYSNVYIHDRNGLVTRAVAVREVARSALESRPGHDKSVGRKYFMDENPTVVQAKVVRTWNPRHDLRAQILSWHPSDERKAEYVADCAPVTIEGLDNTWIVYLRRIEEGVSSEDAWAAWLDKVIALPGQDRRFDRLQARKAERDEARSDAEVAARGGKRHRAEVVPEGESTKRGKRRKEAATPEEAAAPMEAVEDEPRRGKRRRDEAEEPTPRPVEAEPKAPGKRRKARAASAIEEAPRGPVEEEAVDAAPRKRPRQH